VVKVSIAGQAIAHKKQDNITRIFLGTDGSGNPRFQDVSKGRDENWDEIARACLQKPKARITGVLDELGWRRLKSIPVYRAGNAGEEVERSERTGDDFISIPQAKSDTFVDIYTRHPKQTD